MAVTVALTMATLLSLAVATQAAPTPGPTPTPTTAPTSSPSPTPSPSPTASVPADCKGVPIDPMHAEFIWCVTWADNNADRTVTCNRATSPDARVMCLAVTQHLDADPAKQARSVLGGNGKVDCNFWDVLLNSPTLPTDETRRLVNRKAACMSYKGYLESRVSQLASTLPEECGIANVPCQVKKAVTDALADGIGAGIKGLVQAVVGAVTWLLGRLADWVFTTTTWNPDDGFYTTYNLVAGSIILFIFVYFLVATIISGMRLNGPGPLATIGGLIRAVLGVGFAGGIAWTITAMWDSATTTLIEANENTPWDPGAWITALNDLTDGAGTLIVALLIGSAALVALVVLFIVMMFRSPLLSVTALFGSVAFGGQIMSETRSWTRRWFWAVNALASSKFFIAALWIYGSRELQSTDSFITAMQMLLLLWLMVACPWILLRITSIWDGYLADPNGRALLAAGGQATGIGSMLDKTTGLFNKSDTDSASGDSTSGSGDEASDQLASGDDIPTNPTDPSKVIDGEIVPDGDGDGEGGDDKPGKQAAEAADHDATGDQVGKPADPEGAGDPGGGTQEDGQNAGEADGLKEGTESAQKNVENGELTTPGDSTGENGSLPLIPETGAGGDESASPHMPNPTEGPDSGGDSGGKGSGDAEAAASEIPPVV
ncbi:hypothetical protein AB0M43_23715 [Longispora sp. NPDC051575]|uniref:hypothetical protein n=1 Tax=Longispora sp. NPDC051575 TaxID=3154943 RepID=UPI0034127328